MFVGRSYWNSSNGTLQKTENYVAWSRLVFLIKQATCFELMITLHHLSMEQNSIDIAYQQQIITPNQFVQSIMS